MKPKRGNNIRIFFVPVFSSQREVGSDDWSSSSVKLCIMRSDVKKGNFAEVGRDGWAVKPPSWAAHHRLQVPPLSRLEEWLAGLQVDSHIYDMYDNLFIQKGSGGKWENSHVSGQQWNWSSRWPTRARSPWATWCTRMDPTWCPRMDPLEEQKTCWGFSTWEDWRLWSSSLWTFPQLFKMFPSRSASASSRSSLRTPQKFGNFLWRVCTWQPTSHQPSKGWMFCTGIALKAKNHRTWPLNLPWKNARNITTIF